MPRKSLMLEAPTPTRELRTRKPTTLPASDQTLSPTKDKAALQQNLTNDCESDHENSHDDNSQTRGRRPTRTAARNASDKIKTSSQARSLSRGVSVDTVTSQTDRAGIGLPKNVPTSTPNSARRSARTAAKRVDHFAGTIQSGPAKFKFEKSSGQYDEESFRQCWNESRLDAQTLHCSRPDDTRSKHSVVVTFKLSPRNQP